MAQFKKEKLLDMMAQFPLVPVFNHADAELTKKVIKSCYLGGIRVFEFTNRGENARQVFKEIYPFVRTHCPEMALGIGTIFTSAQALSFANTGADFIVQPVTTVDVAELCEEKDLLWVPGVATANEIYTATQLGANIVKIFPGNVLGPGFVKALSGPMPHVKLMVTGGVEPTSESIQSWFKAGVTCVGIGSQLFPASLLKKGSFEELSSQISQLMVIAKNHEHIS